MRGICNGTGVTSVPLDPSLNDPPLDVAEAEWIGLITGNASVFDSGLSSVSPPGIPLSGMDPGERAPSFDAPLDDALVESTDAAEEVLGSFNDPRSWVVGSAGFEPATLLSGDPPGMPLIGIKVGLGVVVRGTSDIVVSVDGVSSSSFGSLTTGNESVVLDV